MTLTEALSTRERVEVQYRCGSVHKGRIRAIGGSYFIAYNTRALVMTRVDLDAVCSIRYTNSKVYLFKRTQLNLPCPPFRFSRAVTF